MSASRTLVRIIGRTMFGYQRPPGDGADQIEAHWRVGKCSMVLVPAKDGEFTGVWCRLLDWFQPDGDPALTIYVFASENVPASSPTTESPSHE